MNITSLNCIASNVNQVRGRLNGSHRQCWEIVEEQKQIDCLIIRNRKPDSPWSNQTQTWKQKRRERLHAAHTMPFHHGTLVSSTSPSFVVPPMSPNVFLSVPQTSSMNRRSKIPPNLHPPNGCRKKRMPQIATLKGEKSSKASSQAHLIQRPGASLAAAHAETEVVRKVVSQMKETEKWAK